MHCAERLEGASLRGERAGPSMGGSHCPVTEKGGRCALWGGSAAQYASRCPVWSVLPNLLKPLLTFDTDPSLIITFISVGGKRFGVLVPRPFYSKPYSVLIVAFFKVGLVGRYSCKDVVVWASWNAGNEF